MKSFVLETNLQIQFTKINKIPLHFISDRETSVRICKIDYVAKCILLNVLAAISTDKK